MCNHVVDCPQIPRVGTQQFVNKRALLVRVNDSIIRKPQHALTRNYSALIYIDVCHKLRNKVVDCPHILCVITHYLSDYTIYHTQSPSHLWIHYRAGKYYPAIFSGLTLLTNSDTLDRFPLSVRRSDSGFHLKSWYCCLHIVETAS